MTLPTDPSEISTDMIMAGIEALRPKGTQPADDQPVAVVTIYRSSFVLAMHSPEFDSDNPAHRSWFIDRCYQAAQSVAAKTTGDGNNAVLSAEETIVPLASATVRAAPAAAGFAAPVLDAMRRRWFVGAGAEVRDRLRAFAETHGVDEIMISPVAGAYDAEPMESADGRAHPVRNRERSDQSALYASRRRVAKQERSTLFVKLSIFDSP